MYFLSRSWLILFLLCVIASCADDPELTEPRRQDNFEYFKKSDGLASNEVTALYEDKDGNLWIGSYGSVTFYNGTTFKRYTTADGVIDAAITDISHDGFGNVWAGSYDGYSVFNGEQWGTEYGLGITALYLDENNLFWVGSFGYGLFQIQENGQINSFELPCDECNYYTNIFTDLDGDVWLTTLGGAIDFNDGQFTRYNSSKGVNNVLTAGACDSWGDLWLGGLDSDKLNRISGGEVSSVTIPTGEISINSIASIGKTVYIATTTGLLYHDGTVIREFQTPEQDYYFYTLLSDSKGNLWMGTVDNGLIRFTPKEF